MPKVKDVKNSITEICSNLNKISGIKKIYIFGSFIENEHNSNFPIRDLDVLVSTNFDSGDLLSITNDNNYPLSMKEESLIELGYNPKSINFTKKFISINDFNMDHWASSKDNKILHWGPMVDCIDDWEKIKIEAENYAQKKTGLSRDKLKNDDIKYKWKTEYDNLIAMYLKNIPNGWYLSSHKPKEIIQKAKEFEK